MTHDQLANEEFERAHMRAFWRRIGAWLTGTPNALLSYDDVRQRLPILGQHYRGLQQVPVKNIVAILTGLSFPPKPLPKTVG